MFAYMEIGRYYQDVCSLKCFLAARLYMYMYMYMYAAD